MNLIGLCFCSNKFTIWEICFPSNETNVGNFNRNNLKTRRAFFPFPNKKSENLLFNLKETKKNHSLE